MTRSLSEFTSEGKRRAKQIYYTRVTKRDKKAKSQDDCNKDLADADQLDVEDQRGIRRD